MSHEFQGWGATHRSLWDLCLGHERPCPTRQERRSLLINIAPEFLSCTRRMRLMGPYSSNSFLSFFSVTSKLMRDTNRVLKGSPCSRPQRITSSSLHVDMWAS